MVEGRLTLLLIEGRTDFAYWGKVLLPPPGPTWVMAVIPGFFYLPAGTLEFIYLLVMKTSFQVWTDQGPCVLLLMGMAK